MIDLAKTTFLTGRFMQLASEPRQYCEKNEGPSRAVRAAPVSAKRQTK